MMAAGEVLSTGAGAVCEIPVQFDTSALFRSLPIGRCYFIIEIARFELRIEAQSQSGLTGIVASLLHVRAGARDVPVPTGAGIRAPY